MGKMNRFQIAVAKTYADGDFAHMIETDDWRSEITNAYDTLFKFLMIELSTEEGCETEDDAHGRIETAIADLYKALEAL